MHHKIFASVNYAPQNFSANKFSAGILKVAGEGEREREGEGEREGEREGEGEK